MSSSSSSRQPSSSQPSSTDKTVLSTFSQSSSFSSLRSLSTSTQINSSNSTSPYPSTSPTSSTSQNDLSTTLTSFPATNTGTSGSGGSLGNRAAVIATLTVFGVLSLILLMIFICCRRNQRNQVLQARARERSREMHRRATTVRRRRSYEKASSHGMTNERRTEHMENGFVVRSFTEQPSDDGDDALHETKSPQLIECSPVFAIDDRDSGLEDPLDRQVHPRGPQPPPHDQTTIPNNPLVITPSRAHLPFPRWRRLPRPPPSPSVYPVILSTEGDKYAVRQLPIPMKIVCTETAVAPNRKSNRGATARGSASGNYPTTPPNLENGRGHTDVLPADPGSDGLRQSYPPPIPQKNPLRRGPPTRTVLNVQTRKSRPE